MDIVLEIKPTRVIIKINKRFIINQVLEQGVSSVFIGEAWADCMVNSGPII